MDRHASDRPAPPRTDTDPLDPRRGFTDTEEPWLLLDERRDFLVVGKPTRMLSVPGKDPDKRDCLITRIQTEFPEARIVHRLDWDTSGILVIARNARAHSALSKAFQLRQTDKTYIALVDRAPEEEAGLIDQPIGPDMDRRPRYRIDPEHGRAAQTRYRVLDTRSEACRLQLEPITGRSHQLRVHLLSLDRPIQGDSLYHPEPHRHPRLMLHARQLTFPDPATGERLSYVLEAPF